jgi:uncharacterized protein (TIGR00251 family)
MKLTETKDGTVIEVFVKPNQPKFKIATDGDEIIVFSTQEPVKGRVNKEIVKQLSKLFHTRVEIISGFNSRQKLLSVKGVTTREVEDLLREERP